MNRIRLSLVPLLLLIAPASAEIIGGCKFDRDTLTFAGTPLEQANCLLRKVELLGAKKEQKLPLVIARLMTQGGAPSAAQKAAAIAAFPEPYRDYALAYQDKPASQTESGMPLLYFVIHDTSEPFMGNAEFPHHLNQDPKINSFDYYLAAEPVAHIFLNRQGQIWAAHDFSIPWRATKLESRVVGPTARGRFVHVETVQPRRFLPGATNRGQTYGPKPGFTPEQYKMLAALYIYASARAGHWLIPAFHSTVDDQIPDAHDDPQNFDLKRFGKELEKLVKA
ncbi:MAG: hypothetical protein ACKOQM_04320 [Novosphingobium sp.]